MKVLNTYVVLYGTPAQNTILYEMVDGSWMLNMAYNQSSNQPMGTFKWQSISVQLAENLLAGQ